MFTAALTLQGVSATVHHRVVLRYRPREQERKLKRRPMDILNIFRVIERILEGSFAEPIAVRIVDERRS